MRLIETPGLGRAGARRLMAAFGSPENVLGAGEAALSEVVNRASVRALLAPDALRDSLPALTWRWLETAPAHCARDVIALGDARYPASLLQTGDPPLLLYVE
ncbi:MAG: DNA-protecting protein DprA, partial [Burkholderiaceae bacterium]